MKPLLPTLVAALLVATACKKEQQHENEQHHDHPEREHEHDGGLEEAMVHIDPDMIRDLRVTTYPVEERVGGEGVTALGELAPNQTMYAEVSSPVSARVLAVAAAPGDAVKKGQPLLTLQSRELGEARAQLQSTRARASAARKAAERKRSLAAENVVSEREAQAAEAEAADAAAQLASAQAAVAALGISEEDVSGPAGGTAMLRSPVAGTVLERTAVLGQVVEPTQTLFKVGDLSSLWLLVHSFERDVVRINSGVEARVTFAAMPGKSFTAKVTAIGQSVEPASRTVQVRLELANPGNQLKPGMSATAFIPLGEGERIISVPSAAVQRLEGGWFVFIPAPEVGAYERREVGRGRTLGGEVEILSGLRPGGRVVVEGAFLLKAEFEKSKGEGEHHEH